MGIDIRWVVILIRVICVRGFLSDLPGNAVIALRGIIGNIGGGDHNFRTECPHQVFFLVTHFVGHGDDAPVALHRSDHGEGGSCIPGGIFHNRAAGFQEPLSLRILDDKKGHPVLYASRGIQKFQLCKDV